VGRPPAPQADRLLGETKGFGDINAGFALIRHQGNLSSLDLAMGRSPLPDKVSQFVLVMIR